MIRQGGISGFFIVTAFVLRPAWNLVLSTCLPTDWRQHPWCEEMGIRYPEYPTDTDGLNEFRKTLFDPTIVLWFQSGTEEWFRIAEVTTVHCNSSLGTAFDGRRVPGREDGAEESFHICLKKPCTFKSSKTTNYRVPVHLSKFAYSDGITEVPTLDDQQPPLGGLGEKNVPAKVGPVVPPWLSPWKLGVGALVLATSGVTKVSTSFPDMTAKQILTSGFRYSPGFIINNVLTVFTSVECGFIEGLGDSLWATPEWWFPWLLRALCYGTLLHHFGATGWGCRKLVSGLQWCRRNRVGKVKVPGSIPNKTPQAIQVTGGTGSDVKCDSEPSSERTDYGRMAHCVYMKLEIKKNGR